MSDRRLTLLVTLTLTLLAAPLRAEAPQPAKVARIGILGNNPLTDPEAARVWGAFIQGLRELGYVEGQNIVIERRFSEGRYERVPALAAELVRLKVDVIVAASQTVEDAKRATSTIPIVMTNHGDPVGSGLVANLARPGGNVTGLSLLSTGLVGKQLQLLTEAVPGLSRVAVLLNPTYRRTPPALREAEVAARSLKVQLQILEARAPSEIAGAFSAVTNESAGALLLISDPMLWRERTRIADLAAKLRLPMMAQLREHAEAGGLLAYGASFRERFRSAATYVDKILKGAKPGDLPVEQPTKFDLVINMKTAKALGLTIPRSVLVQANEIIE